VIPARKSQRQCVVDTTNGSRAALDAWLGSAARNPVLSSSPRPATGCCALKAGSPPARRFRLAEAAPRASQRPAMLTARSAPVLHLASTRPRRRHLNGTKARRPQEPKYHGALRSPQRGREALTASDVTAELSIASLHCRSQAWTLGSAPAPPNTLRSPLALVRRRLTHCRGVEYQALDIRSARLAQVREPGTQ
jgi:hypothetical protein